MTLEPIKMEFKNFQPDYDTHILLQQVATNIQSHAPSDARVRLVFEKKNQWVRAYARVISKARVFLAEALADTPDSAMHDLEKKLMHQINKWKRNRIHLGIWAS
jgi:hypothetical protein